MGPLGPILLTINLNYLQEYLQVVVNYLQLIANH